MPLWLGQRLSKDYLPPEEKLQLPRGVGGLGRGGLQCTPALCSASKAHLRCSEPVSWVTSMPVVGDRWCLTPQTTGCMLEDSGDGGNCVARTAWCQVSWFRQERKLGSKGIVRIFQPLDIPAGHLTLSFTTEQCVLTYPYDPYLLQGHGVSCLSAYKSQSAPNRST